MPRPSRRDRTIALLAKLSTDPGCAEMSVDEFIAHAGRYGLVRVDCHLCTGSGKIGGDPCIQCRGAGTVWTTEAVA